MLHGRSPVRQPRTQHAGGACACRSGSELGHCCQGSPYIYTRMRVFEYLCPNIDYIPNGRCSSCNRAVLPMKWRLLIPRRHHFDPNWPGALLLARSAPTPAASTIPRLQGVGCMPSNASLGHDRTGLAARALAGRQRRTFIFCHLAAVKPGETCAYTSGA